MLIKELLYKFLVLKPTGIKNLKVYRPTQVIISDNVMFNITKSLSINKPWDGYRGLPSIFKVLSNATINCKDFSFHQCHVVIYEKATLNLGCNSFMNNGGRLYCKDSISIGDNTFIGFDVEIRDTDNHNIVGTKRVSSVVIGNNVWIGSKSIILKGTTIGDGAIIGAGSVVTHDIPSCCLAVGNPAKVIRENVEWIS